jgi:CHAD domain-containing protein
VLAYLRDQGAAISHYDPLVRRDEPDAVHQMRVAARRARSALEAFGGIIDRETTRPLCAELKWLAATLGQARDSEVLQARLTADLAAIPPPWSWARCRPASPPTSPRPARARWIRSTGSATSACSMTSTCCWPTRR